MCTVLSKNIIKNGIAIVKHEVGIFENSGGKKVLDKFFYKHKNSVWVKKLEILSGNGPILILDTKI